MPTNRTRTARVGGGLDQFRREMLFSGPGDMLLAGVGYNAGRRAGIFANCEPDEQSLILTDMRADWSRHGPELVADWRARGLSSAAKPSWAEREFGAS